MTFFPFFFIGVWVVTGAAIVVSSTIVEVVVGIDSVVFVGDGFFFLLHPSSLLGWTSVSVFVFVFPLAAVVVVVVVVFTLVFVVSLAVVVVLFVAMVAFCGQDREKCPNRLQFQQSGFLPSTMIVIVVSLYEMV